MSELFIAKVVLNNGVISVVVVASYLQIQMGLVGITKDGPIIVSEK